MIGGGSGPARHRRSASAATFAADAMGAAAADATSLPSEDTVLSWLTLAASTAASGSGSGRPPTPGGTWMPRPAPPPAAELQPWATVLAAGGRLSAAEEDTKVRRRLRHHPGGCARSRGQSVVNGLNGVIDRFQLARS